MICLRCKTGDHEKCKDVGPSVVRSWCDCQHKEESPVQPQELTIYIQPIESAEEFGEM